MSHGMNRKMSKALATWLCTALAGVVQAQLTPGRIVVSTVPADAPATGAPITLREFNAAGELGNVWTLPATGAQALIADNDADQPGVTLAGDGEFLLMPGYAVDTGGTLPLATSPGNLVPRAVGRAQTNGAFSHPFPDTGLSSGTRQLAAASDGTGLWAIGAGEGITYHGPGTPDTVVAGSFRHLIWANSELYASAADGIHRIGTGAPTTGPQATTLVIAEAGITGFCMNTAGNVCYAINGTAVQKWVYDGFNWVMAYAFQSSNSTGAPVAVALDASGAQPVLYAVSQLDRLFKWVDAGGPSAPTIITGTGDRPTGVAVLQGAGCISGLPCDDGDPNSSNDLTQPDCGCAGTALRLSARVLLSGPLDAGTLLMNDALRTAAGFPLSEPYTAIGLPPTNGPTAIDPSVLQSPGPDAIVDWVCLEVRSATTPGQVLFRRSVLLQRDGDVVDVDGASEVGFPAVAGDYHAAIRHRAHLGVMTQLPILLSATPLQLRFNDPSFPTHGNDAQRSVAGAMALWCGDANSNGTVKYTGVNNDRDPILVTLGSTTPNKVISAEYRTEDVNMDGLVKYTGADNDRDPVLITVGGTTPNGIRVQQLP